MVRSLPPRPSLELLRNQAKDILKAHRAGDASVCPLLRHLPRFAQAKDADVLAAAVKLDDAQFSLAIDYGFESWPKLKHHVELTQQARESLGHWRRYAGDDDQKVQMVMRDPEWAALLKREQELAPLSKAATAIRERIASVEACHACYVANVKRILAMVGSMEPEPVLDCGQPDAPRRQHAGRYCRALWAWLDDTASDGSEEARRVTGSLGRPDDRKRELAQHLVRKLKDNQYHACPWDQEDFDRTESRITHLEVCHCRWPENIVSVLDEIGSGERTVDWHGPNGFGACGDSPDRAAELADVLDGVGQWLASDQGRAGVIVGVLGESTPEKGWLAECLAKHIRSSALQ